MGRTQRHIHVACFLLLVIASPVDAKCALGTVRLHGTIKNWSSERVGLEAAVVLRTPKETIRKSTVVTDGTFSVELRFDTFSSFMWLLGDRCHTVPNVVEVNVLAGVKSYGQRQLRFKDYFRPTRPLEYDLKGDLSIDIDLSSSHSP